MLRVTLCYFEFFDIQHIDDIVTSICKFDPSIKLSIESRIIFSQEGPHQGDSLSRFLVIHPHLLPTRIQVRVSNRFLWSMLFIHRTEALQQYSDAVRQFEPSIQQCP